MRNTMKELGYMALIAAGSVVGYGGLEASAEDVSKAPVEISKSVPNPPKGFGIGNEVKKARSYDSEPIRETGLVGTVFEGYLDDKKNNRKPHDALSRIDGFYDLWDPKKVDRSKVLTRAGQLDNNDSFKGKLYGSVVEDAYGHSDVVLSTMSEDDKKAYDKFSVKDQKSEKVREYQKFVGLVSKRDINLLDEKDLARDKLLIFLMNRMFEREIGNVSEILKKSKLKSN